jgi:cytochrome c oxidase assembly protein subunit 15
MGCPDWPKCFGYYIPQTHPDQVNFHPNQSYTKGMMVIVNDTLWRATAPFKSGEVFSRDHWEKYPKHDYAEFYVQKTWIEYINRLIGVVIGLLILATLIKSFSLWSQDKWIPGTAFLALVLVSFTGWIGSIVVSTNLLAWMITFHMLLALALVAVLLYSHRRATRLLAEKNSTHLMPKKILWLLLSVSFLMLIQVVLGTQVREGIDRVSFAMGNLLREEWVSKVGIVFLIHRSFSLVLLGVHVLYFIWAFKFSIRSTPFNNWNQALLALLVIEIASGIGMAYFGLPAYLQPIHLLFGSLILGVQFILILQLKDQTYFKSNLQV